MNFKESLKKFLSENSIVLAGRGPSKTLHIAHLFIAKLLNQINLPVLFQISDDEKAYRDNVNFSDLEQFYAPYYKIFGDKKNTQIFLNSKNSHKLYELIFKYGNRVKVSKIFSIFGYSHNSTMGELNYALVQALTPLYLTEKYNTKKIGIITGIDQKPFFEVLCKQITTVELDLFYIPVTIGLDGQKMSSSMANTINLYDSNECIRIKIKKALSSNHKLGEAPTEEHLKKDFCYNILNIIKMLDFSNSQKILDILISYKLGRLSSSNLKEKTTNIIITFLTEFKQEYNL